MVNCNPETVSTDYDTSDRLYFEPLTYEDVMDIVDVERPDGVVVTLGGQTPLKLARALAEPGVPIMGTQPDAIDLAEDRERFAALLDRWASCIRRRARRRVRGGGAWRADRVPAARAPELRAGRPRHDDRLRRGAPSGVHGRGRARLA